MAKLVRGAITIDCFMAAANISCAVPRERDGSICCFEHRHNDERCSGQATNSSVIIGCDTVVCGFQRQRYRSGNTGSSYGAANSLPSTQKQIATPPR